MQPTSKPPRFNCPRCGESLEAAGVVECEGEELPVYQCETCIVAVEFGGACMKGNLTFCVDKNGKAFDPATPDGALPPAA